MRNAKRWGIAVGVVLVLWLIGQGGEQSKTGIPRTVRDTVAERANAERAEDSRLRSDAKEAMRRRLKDPESAQFEQVETYRFSGSPVVCGRVNAKNGFGGYTGSQEFLYSAGAAITRDDMQEAAFVKLWNSSCVAPRPTS